MSDLPSSLLLQQSHARSISGEDLETFGRQAAEKYASGTPLTQAVVETVKKAGLSPEQVRRVTEFANTETFLREFKKEGSEHRVVNFDGGPADYSRVLQDLNDGGGGTVFDYGNSDYSHEPSKKASVRDDFEVKLASMFEVGSTALPYAEPLRDAMDLKDKLAAVYDEIAHELSTGENVFGDISDYLYNQVKQAALNGASLGDVVQVWSLLSPDPIFIKTAFQLVTPRLVSDGVMSRADLNDSIAKTAHNVTPNPEHPLVDGFQAYCESLNKLAALRQVQGELEAGLDSISTFLKAAAEEVVVKDNKPISEVIKKVWHGSKELSEKAAPHTADLARAAVGGVLGHGAGETASKVVGGITKKAPHIAAALAAEAAYQRAKYSPTVQGTKNFVLSRVPYTNQNMIRQYNLQNSNP